MKESSSATYISGSLFVDALITAKHLTMKEHGIQFDYTPLSVKLPISEVEFCTVLGNILDNAIEGVMRIVNPDVSKKIILSFVQTRGMLYVQCANPCDETLLKRRNQTWLSTKSSNKRATVDSIGINSIRRIVENNSGRSLFQAKDGMFHVQITLPYPFGTSCAEHK